MFKFEIWKWVLCAVKSVICVIGSAFFHAKLTKPHWGCQRMWRMIDEVIIVITSFSRSLTHSHTHSHIHPAAKLNPMTLKNACEECCGAFENDAHFNCQSSNDKRFVMRFSWQIFFHIRNIFWSSSWFHYAHRLMMTTYTQS